MLPCLVAIGLAAVVLVAAGVEAATLVTVGAVIACPLMMILMMGGGMHRLARRHQGDREPANTSPVEDVTDRVH